jgi:hypothetical protein
MSAEVGYKPAYAAGVVLSSMLFAAVQLRNRWSILLTHDKSHTEPPHQQKGAPDDTEQAHPRSPSSVWQLGEGAFYSPFTKCGGVDKPASGQAQRCSGSRIQCRSGVNCPITMHRTLRHATVVLFSCA